MSRITHIAVVDDDAPVRQSLATLLRSFRLRTTTYESADAFLAVRRPEVDCVVSDVQMPGRSGIDLQLAMAEHYAGSPPPLVLMTAFPQTVSRHRAVGAGAVAYFEKPVDGDELIACLRRVVPDFCAEE